MNHRSPLVMPWTYYRLNYVLTRRQVEWLRGSDKTLVNDKPVIVGRASIPMKYQANTERILHYRITSWSFDHV